MYWSIFCFKTFPFQLIETQEVDELEHEIGFWLLMLRSFSLKLSFTCFRFETYVNSLRLRLVHGVRMRLMASFVQITVTESKLVISHEDQFAPTISFALLGMRIYFKHFDFRVDLLFRINMKYTENSYRKYEEETNILWSNNFFTMRRKQTGDKIGYN